MLVCTCLRGADAAGDPGASAGWGDSAAACHARYPTCPVINGKSSNGHIMHKETSARVKM